MMRLVTPGTIRTPSCLGITKYGLVPGNSAPPDYESDMPTFSDVLSDDEIWAVLAYIKSHWTSP